MHVGMPSLSGVKQKPFPANLLLILFHGEECHHVPGFLTHPLALLAVGRTQEESGVVVDKLVEHILLQLLQGPSCICEAFQANEADTDSCYDVHPNILDVFGAVWY